MGTWTGRFGIEDSSRLVWAALSSLVLLLAGCSGGPGGGGTSGADTGDDTVADADGGPMGSETGTDSGAMGEDTEEGPTDTGMSDDADGAGEDAGDGGGRESEVPDSWLVCGSTADCPIQGTTCVKTLSFNRIDHTGAASVKVSAVLERVDEGSGVCSRPCSNDPSVCQSLKWDDASGESARARCHVLSTGASPYELAGQMGFDNEMKKGQAFAALCLPPVEKSDERPGDVCRDCSEQSECDGATSCVNMRDDSLRESSEETGASICASRCQAASDCAVGFECVQVGVGGNGEEMGGDAGMADGGSTDAGMGGDTTPPGDAGTMDAGTTDGGLGDAGMGDGGMADAGMNQGPTEGFCLPASRTCDGCQDRDGDGRGTGHCERDGNLGTTHDCDDTTAEAYYDPSDMEHPWPAYCGPEDYNCDGVPDDTQVIGNEQYGKAHCASCGDTCSGMASGGGVYQCVTEMSTASGYACIADCPKGKAADCDGDPTNGCEVTLKKAKNDASLEKYLFYTDGDGDRHGKPGTGQVFCSKADAKKKTGKDLVADGDDCNDSSKYVHPGSGEYCDGIDNSCESNPMDPKNIDEGCDSDDDTFCDAGMTYNKYSDEAGSTCTVSPADCDDDNKYAKYTFPGSAEEEFGPNNNKCTRDVDDDGWASHGVRGGGTRGTDCDDNDPDVNPGGSDNEPGPQRCMLDADDDGYGDPNGVNGQHASDCDDSNPAVNPGAQEMCNGVDDDCDGKIDEGSVEGAGGKFSGASCTRSGVKGMCQGGSTYECNASTSNSDPSVVDYLDCTNDNPTQPTFEKPGFDGKDHSCDGHDRYLSPESGRKLHALWVQAGTSGNGLKPGDPMASLGQALRAADGSRCNGIKINGQPVPCDIYIGSKVQSIPSTEIPNGAHVWGGLSRSKWSSLDSNTWNGRSGKTTVRLQDPGANNGVGGLWGQGFYASKGDLKTVLTGLTIQGADVSSRPGASTVAFWCEECPGLWMSKVTINAGAAGDGSDGDDAPLVSNGYDGATNGTTCFERIENANKRAYVRQLRRTSGRTLHELRHLGKGGTQSLGGANFFDSGSAGDANGEDGRDGVLYHSQAGGAGSSRFRLSGAGVSFPVDSAEDGKFNDGGGGSAGYHTVPGPPLELAGGSGGCPGLGGEAGTSGGSSVAMLLAKSSGVYLDQISTTAAKAGRGGAGGKGGKGGTGGQGEKVNSIWDGGQGGDGAGGNGGGGGSGGHSIGCLLLDFQLGGGNFDKRQNCNAGTGGRKGPGGDGGKSEGGGATGHDGADGAAGLTCGVYDDGRSLSWSGATEIKPESKYCN